MQSDLDHALHVTPFHLSQITAVIVLSRRKVDVSNCCDADEVIEGRHFPTAPCRILAHLSEPL
jgi:hypothetical protein